MSKGIFKAIRDWFTGEDARKQCEGLSQEQIADIIDQRNRRKELDKRAEEYKQWAIRVSEKFGCQICGGTGYDKDGKPCPNLIKEMKFNKNEHYE